MLSDENLWVEKQHPNKQNERNWANHDPNVEIDCKQQGRRAIMCWAGLINGEVILHWFNVGTLINQDVYLNRHVAKNLESLQQETILVSGPHLVLL